MCPASGHHLPDNQQWNVTLERDRGRGTVFSMGYIGNKGTHLFRSVNANGACIDPATNTVVESFSSIYGTTAINMRLTDGTSIYNAMQTQFRRQVRSGLVFQATWTWAKGIDDVGTAINNKALDVQNLGRDRAGSDYVRRHMLQMNATYELPIGRGHTAASAAPRWLDAMIGGWRLSGVYTFATGAPFTPTFTAQGGFTNNRPDVVYGERRILNIRRISNYTTIPAHLGSTD